jgi:hypothetical protein
MRSFKERSASRSNAITTSRPPHCFAVTTPFKVAPEDRRSIIDDLPDKIEQTKTARSAEQATLYQAVVDDLLETAANSEASSAAGSSSRGSPSLAGVQPPSALPRRPISAATAIRR